MAEAWSNVQWWASISFGLIALASFGRERLNLFTVAGLAVLYSIFTVYSLVNTMAMVVHAASAREALSALADSEGISAAGAGVLRFTEAWGLFNGALFMICFGATFVGSLAYLWYSYRKASTSS